ncbi:MAG: pyridoxal-dependent decarboxylase [Patescibacteria group bacterium]
MNGYKRIINFLRSEYFLSSNGGNANKLVNLLDAAIKSVISEQGNGPIYDSNIDRRTLYQVALESKMPLKVNNNFKILLTQIKQYLQGSVKANDPFMVKNVIPLPSFSYLATFVAVSLYMPNGVTGEDAASVLDAEISCASALSKLAGYDFNKAAGVFTFGGTGTNLYALKIGMMKAAPDHATKGVNDNNLVVIGSRASHYCHKTSANWLGIGQNNYIQVQTNIDQTMKIDDFKKVCRQALASGKKIACIEVSGGTTSNMAIDDIESIYKIREQLVLEFDLKYRPHIHVDSVIGWAYLNFNSYDFKKNILGFSNNGLAKIKKISSLIKKINYADSFGVDFHKTGYTPYVSSMIIVKNQTDFELLRRDMKIMTPLFHDDFAYNPGIFTLETSRSAANMLATWCTMQTLGIEGFQTLLGHSLEMSSVMREELAKYENIGLYLANKKSYGCDIFIRCYPPGVIPNKTYKKELKNDDLLMVNTTYTSGFADWIFKNKTMSKNGIAISKSSASFYTLTGKPMVALRIYSLNPNLNESLAKEIISRLAILKKEFDNLF